MIPIVIITSTSKRHVFFANHLAKNFNILGIVSEKKSSAHPENCQVNRDPEVIRHFESRKQAEEKYFTESLFNVGKNKILEINNKDVNGPKVYAWIKNLGPQFIILFGSSIVKEPLMKAYAGKIINIHLGLSPYYRGSGTNFWPLVFGEPECVGATIHIAAEKVDAGPILGQIRPENIRHEDNSHDIGCKALISGAKKMVECINNFYEKKIPARIQDLSIGSIFKSTNFNTNSVIKMLKNFEKGMIADYLAHKKKRDDKFPIIS